LQGKNVNELALFAGAGGGILGGKLLGWKTVCGVECDRYAASVLVARQNDGHLPAFPIWDDVRTFDGRPWAGIVDVVSGGFPCQDISAAGKGKGLDGERSGLWREMARITGEVRPQFVFVENSPLLVQRGLAVVLADLASLGFDARWCTLSAGALSAPHKRERFWLVGFHADTDYASRIKRSRRANPEDWSQGIKVWNRGISELVSEHLTDRATSYRRALRILDGVADRVDRLSVLGNGQVPAVAGTAWQILTRGVT
jgi:DNA (cytosine-5)-methyltransferase 1